MVILPVEDYEETRKLIEEIHSHLFSSINKREVLNEYISEKDAIKEFERKTTWFWNQRKSGRLPFKKLGSKVFYLKTDLHNLLNKESYE